MADEKRSFDLPLDEAPIKGAGDNPQEDWGEPADEGAVYSSNHSTRGEKPDRSPGRKTRQATKDLISRRL